MGGSGKSVAMKYTILDKVHAEQLLSELLQLLSWMEFLQEVFDRVNETAFKSDGNGRGLWETSFDDSCRKTGGLYGLPAMRLDSIPVVMNIAASMPDISANASAKPSERKSIGQILRTILTDILNQI